MKYQTLIGTISGDIMTKYESAELILKLFELRREEKMREARTWWYGFNPKSIDDIKAVYQSPDSAKFRMCIGYWDMAATLVNHGAIDQEMFFDTNSEFMPLFAKLQPFLEEMRKTQPYLLVQLEKLVMRKPDAQKRLETIRASLIKK